MNETDYDFSASSEQLLEMCKRQDQDALRLLLRRYERPVYNLLYRMLSSHEEAEEALAEVFVKVWRAAAGFKGDSKFTTWLYKIASNTARDFLRSRKAQREVSIEDVIIDEAFTGRCTSLSPADPEKSVIDALDRQRIINAMSLLSEEDRLLVTLYHLQECDYDEISKITNISPSNLKVKLFRARQRLKKLCLREDMQGDNNEMRTDTTDSAGLRARQAESA
ncbi:RNA polymerase sigma factor [bacterium]|nr:RNA polymerase sigma factor [bacterium]